MVLVEPRREGVELELPIQSTGNTGRGKGNRKLKSRKAITRLKKVKDFIAQKSKFINASEFSGNGKTIEIIDYSDADGKLGPVLQVKFRDPKNNRDRIWNISSVRAARAIELFQLYRGPRP